jgi:hypothetical protein
VRTVAVSGAPQDRASSKPKVATAASPVRITTTPLMYHPGAVSRAQGSTRADPDQMRGSLQNQDRLDGGLFPIFGAISTSLHVPKLCRTWQRAGSLSKSGAYFIPGTLSPDLIILSVLSLCPCVQRFRPKGRNFVNSVSGIDRLMREPWRAPQRFLLFRHLQAPPKRPGCRGPRGSGKTAGLLDMMVSLQSSLHPGHAGGARASPGRIQAHRGAGDCG